jgi:hypothetical protein
MKHHSGNTDFPESLFPRVPKVFDFAPVALEDIRAVQSLLLKKTT